MLTKRLDGRAPLELRKIELIPNYLRHPMGSCLVRWGDNIIVVSATVQEGAPPFCKPLDQGWITAEYRLLPAATPTRNVNLNSSRSAEIRRLIGRSLRAGVDLRALRDLTIVIDCEVLQADGGTRVACITGGFVALVWALKSLWDEQSLQWKPLKGIVTALSAVVTDNQLLIDPNFLEDSSADLDINLVFNDEGEVIELQTTAERRTISPRELLKHVERMLEVGAGIRELQVASMPEAWKELLNPVRSERHGS